jgi:hypothetical protein
VVEVVGHLYQQAQEGRVVLVAVEVHQQILVKRVQRVKATQAAVLVLEK